MKTFLLSLLTLLSVSFLSASETKIWNRNWEFKRGDATTWQTCHLPHSFSAPYFLGQDFYTGDGFYRKTLLPEMYGNAKNVFLDFEGAFQFVEVFLDGVRVGEHRSGYTGFRVNLTPALKRHQAQELSVRVNNAWDSRTAPRAGEHIFTGGINRDVTLVTEGNVYIERNGITFTTPKVSAEQAIAEVRVEIRNSSSQTQKVHLQTTLHDYANSYPPATVQTRTTQEVLLPPNSCTVATVALPAVNRPKLWSPDSPTLYLLAVELRQPKFLGLFGGGRISEKTAEVGFRWFEFTKDKGFFLNGKPLFLIGANVHQDNAGWGDGITNGAHARDVRLMKAAGFNFIRGSHYPHDPAFLAACDRLGLLFWSEGGVWGMGGGTADNRYWATSAVPHLAADREPYAQSAERLVREMIRDAKNHPSVIVWSVSNEPFFLDGAPDNLEVATALIKRLLNVVKEEDSTRPAAVGGAQRGGFDQLGGIIGYNGDGAKIFRNPPGPSIVAEYGSTISKRPGAYAPGWGDFGNDRPAWRSGAAIWCGFDHGSIWESGSRMGIVDYFRIPKRSWYWYRNFLLGTPPPAWAKKGVPAALRLTADKVLLTSCAGQDDAQIMVQFVDDK
ncbi:MAG: glycoside hydrolase family 2 TIM barrel-domain containing protein, partial [Kiritimatiellia bacterium]